MANKGRRSWDELNYENRNLKAKLHQMEMVMRDADRVVKIYHMDRWVAVPMHPKQTEAVLAWLAEYGIPEGERKLVGQSQDTDTYEVAFSRNDILPNVRHFVLQYDHDKSEERVGNFRVWALVPA